MELMQGVYLHIKHSKKFKDIGISFRFLAPLQTETATLRSLLAMMLVDRCQKYNTKKKMSEYQDLLYGTTLQAQTVGYGKAQVLEIRSKLLDPVYVEDKQLLRQVLEYMKEVLYAPYLEEDSFHEAKALLKSKIQRLKDDPAQYVIMQGLKHAGKDTPLAISSLGEESCLGHCTLEDVKAVHQKMLQEQRIDILVCGNVEQDTVQTVIQEVFPFAPRNAEVETHYCVQGIAEQKLQIEKRDIQQSSLVMLWQTNCDICDKQFYALRVACAILGQYPTSLLFQEVREKRSLCYSIYANLITFDGALGVTTGIDQNHLQEVVELVKQQFQRVCDGDFEDALLDTTKKMLVNSLLASKDSMLSLMAQQYQDAVLQTNRDIDTRIKAIQAVTKEQIRQVMQQCRYLQAFAICQEDEHE